MPVFVEIAVNVSQVRGVFHYHLPEDLEYRAQPGHLVQVPFGKQTVQGIILARLDSPEVPETRPVLNLVDDEPALTLNQIALARYLAEHTLSNLAPCIELMLPPGLAQRAETLYHLRPDFSPDESSWPVDLTRTQRRLFGAIAKRGSLRTSQLERAFPRQNWKAAAQTLVKSGLLLTETVLPGPAVRPKIVRTARLGCAPAVAEAALPELGRAGSDALTRRQAMLRFLIQETGPVDVSWVYASSGGSMIDLRALEKRGLVILGEAETWRDPLSALEFYPSEPVRLTTDQQSIWAEVENALHTAGEEKLRPILLHGVTGSGKTEIYLKAVEETLHKGRQAIVLVPEIALTPQTVRRFQSRFPGQVGLVHSQLSQGERYDTWRRARSGLISVVVGPRSALFTPMPDVGLIVLDECHDESYYQSEPQPAFHARELAVEYARICGAVCLMGTATPDVTSYEKASRGVWQLLSLPERILGHRQVIQAQAERLGITPLYRPWEEQAETIDLPPVQVVDMRQELKEGNRSIFSRPLQTALGNELRQNRQAILFLNRLGSATYVFCRDCGHTMRCPRCEMPLTYHSAGEETLQCHYCNYRRKMPETCPQCKGRRIRQYGAGTEKVEAEVHTLFPEATTLRWDRETTRSKGAHDAILSTFSAGKADVLVGTQMLAKGLDLPLVTLVGVVLADVGLSLPDYRAAERVFQVLTQVSGRAGRSLLGGRVILQTFQPEHYAIHSAAGHDFQAFYKLEMHNRRRLGYPPFTRLVRLEIRHHDARQAETRARDLAARIRHWMQSAGKRSVDLIGPAPCFFARIGGIYRWQLVLRGPDPVAVLRGKELGEVRIEVEPPSLL